MCVFVCVCAWSGSKGEIRQGRSASRSREAGKGEAVGRRELTSASLCASTKKKERERQRRHGCYARWVHRQARAGASTWRDRLLPRARQPVPPSLATRRRPGPRTSDATEPGVWVRCNRSGRSKASSFYKRGSLDKPHVHEP